MPKRLTSSEKYKDSWFVDLQPTEKLLFYFLIDSVDSAGFYEISFRHLQFFLGISKDEILGAIKGLSRGLLGAESELKNGDKIYLKNFLEHQKMNPLNPFNSYHLSALKAFNEEYQFVLSFPFLSSLKVIGEKKDKGGEIIEKIDKTLLKYLEENQGLTSPLVKVIVKEEVEVKDFEGGTGETLPTLEEFMEYAKSKKPKVNIESVKLKYESWKVNGWRTGGEKPREIKNWKTTLLNTLPHLPESKMENELLTTDFKKYG